MTNQIQNSYTAYNPGTVGTPLYNYGTTTSQPIQQQQTQQPGINPIYQYPETSLYQPAGSQASGVNIIINNPAGMGGGAYPMPYHYPVNAPVQTQAPVPAPAQTPLPQPNAEPVANTPISDEKEKPGDKPTKEIVELTDEYIKSLENYMRSPDKNLRKTAITQMIQRFEEDPSRYDDPALTALLNIALQDPEPMNRMLAMSPMAAGQAHGDANSVKLLQGLIASDKMYGQEASMANEALLNSVQTKKTVVDNNPKQEEKSK